MSVSAVVSPTGALTMVGFLAVVDCRSPDLGETIATLPPSELEWQPAAHSNGVQCSVVYLYLERVEIAVDERMLRVVPGTWYSPHFIIIQSGVVKWRGGSCPCSLLLASQAASAAAATQAASENEASAPCGGQETCQESQSFH